MNGSPSPSPRRLQRQRPVSPLATQPRNNDNSSVDAIGTNNSNGTSSNGRADDQRGFYQVSLSDGPVLPPANPSSNLSSKPSSHLRSFTHSYSQSYSHSSNSYGRSLDLGKDHDRDNNYGYRPSYKDDASAASNNKTSGTSASLRPVQEYHNAYSDTDGLNTVPLDSPLSLPPPPSASGSSSPASKFATFSSASRAFLEHRRNQSIPNLMPTISSIGRNLGRAISPDRSLQSFQPPKRPLIPEYRDERSSRRESYSGDDDSEEEEEDDDDSASSDGSYSDEDEDDSNDDSDDDNEPRHRRSNIMAPFTGDSRTPRHNTTKTHQNDDKQSDTTSVASGFTNWLSGGTVKATSPDRASFLANSRSTTPEPSSFAARGGQGHTRRSMSLASNASLTPRSSILATSNASASRFSQLATSMSATLSRLTQQPRSAGAGFENDELYHLDVDAALFPTGHPSERDAFSPSSYKNLEANAAGALQRMQAAYRQQTVALRDMAAEKSVRDEELEEVEIRAQHLKMQLEGMARRAADQQKEMEILMEELAAEKKARAQERSMLLSSIPTTLTGALINGASPGSPPQERDDDQATSVALSEDLDVDEAQRDQMRRQAWRRRSLKSNGSSIDGTDDGEGSTADDYESGSSMFSRSRSPTIAPSISFSLDNGAAGNENQQQVHHPRVAALGSMRQGSRSVSSSSTATVVSQSQPMSTFQKLVKNVTAAIKDEEPVTGTTSCRNCRGQDVSFAWNTVSVLRDENKHLKQRVGQLEVAVEGALDMVNGVGL